MWAWESDCGEEVLVLEDSAWLGYFVEACVAAGFRICGEDQGRDAWLHDQELMAFSDFGELVEHLDHRQAPAQSWDLIERCLGEVQVGLCLSSE